MIGVAALWTTADLVSARAIADPLGVEGARSGLIAGLCRAVDAEAKADMLLTGRPLGTVSGRLAVTGTLRLTTLPGCADRFKAEWVISDDARKA